MMKKKTAIVLIMGMVMTAGLTGCQKTAGEEMGKNSGQTEETLNTAAVSGTEQEEAPQEESVSENPFRDSPEFQACTEWREFLDGYDTDGSILAEVENEPIAGYQYEAYCCYSKEMEDKIDEICSKYGLSLLGGLQTVDSYSDLLNSVEVGEFCANSESVKHNPLCGYLYSNGTFMIEGNVTLAGSSICEADYQFMRAVKGAVDFPYLDFGDFSGYHIREYTTQKGETVFFVCAADENPHIIAEREKSYVVIGAYGDLSGISDVNDERLELLADAFDFAAIP